MQIVKKKTKQNKETNKQNIQCLRYAINSNLKHANSQLKKQNKASNVYTIL